MDTKVEKVASGGCHDCGAVCREVCPYPAPRFKDEPNAKMQKCDPCLDRMKEGTKPICVAACPMRALDVAPLPELESAWGNAKDAEGFAYSAETAPSIVIRAK